VGKQSNEGHECPNTKRDPDEPSQKEDALDTPVAPSYLLLEGREFDALLNSGQALSVNQHSALVLEPLSKAYERDKRHDHDCNFHVFTLPFTLYTPEPTWRLQSEPKIRCNRLTPWRVSSMMKDEDVDELLRRRRYEGAFGLLLDRYQEKVFRLAFSILREAGRAEEVTQDIFLKLWQALPFYDGRAALSTWLYTIARNTCYSTFRKESIRMTVPIEGGVEPSRHETVSQQAEIKQLLERLPTVQREVITLFYLEDQSIQDVAQMLDLPEGTVKCHLHRARQALAEMMRS